MPYPGRAPGDPDADRLTVIGDALHCKQATMHVGQMAVPFFDQLPRRLDGARREPHQAAFGIFNIALSISSKSAGLI